MPGVERGRNAADAVDDQTQPTKVEIQIRHPKTYTPRELRPNRRRGAVPDNIDD